MPAPAEDGFLEGCVEEDSEAALSSMRKHWMPDQTYMPWKQQGQLCICQQDLHYLMFMDKNYLAIPSLDCPPLIHVWFVSLLSLSLYLNHFANEVSPVSQSKTSQAPSPSEHFICCLCFIFCPPQHLLPSDILIYVACLSPTLDCMWYEGIWSLLYPQMLGQ